MNPAEQGNQTPSPDIFGHQSLEEFAFSMMKQARVSDVRMHQALLRIDRKFFVPEQFQIYAYVDSTLPLIRDVGDYFATISQPSLTVQMIDLLNLQEDSNTLEIGTGSGYSSALMSQLCSNVVSIERIPELVAKARNRLNALQIMNVSVLEADGAKGYAQNGPYDRIISTVAMKKIPDEYVSQLKEGGRLLLPVGDLCYGQYLVQGKKKAGRLETIQANSVQFVPLITDQEDLGWSLQESYESLIFQSQRDLNADALKQQAERLSMSPETFGKLLQTVAGFHDKSGSSR